MEVSKIHLSQSELDLFCNEDIILTKNRIIQKTIDLLLSLQQRMTDYRPPVTLFEVPPKITRGENYLGLPFVILDYPRRSAGQELFFIRSMFWWGHFFSSTLHLSGRFVAEKKDLLIENYTVLCERNFYLGINTDPWVHHFEPANYRRLDSFSLDDFGKRLSGAAHIKIAAKWPLREWHSAANTLYDSWKFLADLVA
ncbi:MAG: hypothetical protein ACO1OO_01780 [Flavisolibacter sp.]